MTDSSSSLSPSSSPIVASNTSGCALASSFSPNGSDLALFGSR
eukprot:CAMPEP_0202830688 /NCGR_PEP_ID=MMETSP1389-20130828/16340_1 /ASSEMBLY_ACC=CAM_ASM_000865 /TAXON_ID=302021 /ORGANISM="Rhodomonas sp., Strain CCMP768" /LENGTH=42 /DNA_ID= /DNA_START= /DNA_END= /DNA_ORIENTATION=